MFSDFQNKTSCCFYHNLNKPLVKLTHFISDSGLMILRFSVSSLQVYLRLDPTFRMHIDTPLHPTKSVWFKDQNRQADLQRETSGRIQGFKPPPSLSIKLQQVRVVLPVGEDTEEGKRGLGSGCGSRTQLRALLPSAGRRQNCCRLNSGIQLNSIVKHTNSSEQDSEFRAEKSCVYITF